MNLGNFEHFQGFHVYFLNAHYGSNIYSFQPITYLKLTVITVDLIPYVIHCNEGMGEEAATAPLIPNVRQGCLLIRFLEFLDLMQLLIKPKQRFFN